MNMRHTLVKNTELFLGYHFCGLCRLVNKTGLAS